MQANAAAFDSRANCLLVGQGESRMSGERSRLPPKPESRLWQKSHSSCHFRFDCLRIDENDAIQQML